MAMTPEEIVEMLCNLKEEEVPDAFFRTLNAKEEKEFREWARNNWREGDPIRSIYHPVVRDEIGKMLMEMGHS